MAEGKKPRAGDLAVFFGLVVLVAIFFSRFGPGGISVPDYVGKPLPPLLVEGWLNRDEGESLELEGSTLVVDCWASWCGPCLAELPRLAEIATEYEPLGVRFVGVTSESAEELANVEEAIGRVDGFAWPVAYGGAHFFEALGVGAIPTMFLFGADGRCRWVGNSTDGLADEIDEALAVGERASGDGAERHRDDAG